MCRPKRMVSVINMVSLTAKVKPTVQTTADLDGERVEEEKGEDKEGRNRVQII